MTISAWRQQLLNGEVSSRELVDEQLERIHSVEPQIHAFVELTADRARADADRIDAARAAGDLLVRLRGLRIGLILILWSRRE